MRPDARRHCCNRSGRSGGGGSTGEPEGDDNDVIRLAAVQKHAPPSRSYADALRHRSRQSHTQRASHRNPRPASSNQRRGSDAITGTGSFGVLKSTGRGLESVNKRKRRSCTGIFVTRLARNTQPRDVIRHIEQETGMRCQCEPIQTKYDSYRSFCIRLNPSLHGDYWTQRCGRLALSYANFSRVHRQSTRFTRSPRD